MSHNAFLSTKDITVKNSLIDNCWRAECIGRLPAPFREGELENAIVK